MKLAFDMSSNLWSCLLAGKDKEGHEVEFEGKQVWINSAAYGYENVINLMVAAMRESQCTPIDCILVKEGFNSKAPRIAINMTYKGKRGKRHPEAYENFAIVRDQVIAVFKNLGALMITQDNVEADDVLGWLAENSRESLTIVSNDGDLCVLDGFNKHGADIITRIGGACSNNPYGTFDNKYISLYKALVGDINDNISGIPGFGVKTWDKFEAAFGEDGMTEMVRLANLYCLDELEAEAPINKMVKQIWDGRKEFLNSWRLASLHPEWCNTIANQIQWFPGLVHGKVTDERLKHWAAHSWPVTAAKWDGFLEWVKPLIAQRSWLSLDIETSTGDDSDDWLAAQGDPDGVDVIGSELTGMSLTFGKNMQHTVYIPVDHADTDNVPKPKAQELLEYIAAQGKEFVIHNTQFEGTVLFNEYGEEWKDNGFEGLLPNWLDTKLEASYVDENNSLGLKKLSKKWFDYDQVDYKTVTTLEGPVGTVIGGVFLGHFEKVITPEVLAHEDVMGLPVVAAQAITETWERRKFKMRELPASHVFSYACDDTICTASFHNFAKLFMQLEGTYDLHKEVEIDASYSHCQSFIHGTKISLAKLAEIGKEDDATYDGAWSAVRDYLITQGWEGTVTPVYTEYTPAAVKESYLIVTGEAVEFSVRLPAKVLDLIKHQPLLHAAWVLALGETPNFSVLNKLVASRYKNEPVFNCGSPTQMKALMYETMGFPVVVANKPTDIMRAAGLKQGTPKTDNLAIAYALQTATPEQAVALKAVVLMKMVVTRRSLYYNPYPYFVHWKTGRVHSSHNQCATNTRRASASKPNVQQVSKQEKVDGYLPKVREVFVPHRKGAVVVSMDFMAQELRIIADYSQDNGMLACFIGDHKKDMHALTGVGIHNYRHAVAMSYEEFVLASKSKSHEFHAIIYIERALGKKTNFTTEFGAMAPKLAQTLMVTVEEAQVFIDAKEAAFPDVAVWKVNVIEQEVKRHGIVRTKRGAVRHLVPALTSGDGYKVSKAERQGVNFKVQSSAGEMTKLAEGRMWKARLEQNFDCEIMFPVHDEIVASVMIEDLHEFIPAMHACMVQPYGGMTVPIMSSISFGRSFGPAHQMEIGDEPTKEAILKGLEEMYKSEKPKQQLEEVTA